MSEPVTTEVAPGLYRMTGPLGEREVAMYLIAGTDGMMLVDCGDFDHADAVVRPALAELGVDPADLRYIVVTHSDADHVGGLAAVAALAPQAAVVAHRGDADDVRDVETLIRNRYDYAVAYGVAPVAARVAQIRARYKETAVDREVGDRTVLRIGADRPIELRHGPGHSPGHLMLLDVTTGSAIIGDAQLADAVPAVDGSPSIPPPYRDVDGYLSTAVRVNRWRPQRLLTGHFPVCEGADRCVAFVEQSRRFVDRVESELREVLAAGTPRSLPWLCATLSPRLGEWPAGAAHHLAAPLLGHLERAEDEQRAHRRRIGAEVTWTLP